MLFLKRTLCYTVQIVATILLGTLILVAVTPAVTGRAVPTVEDFRQGFWLVVFFSVVSGYIFTSAWLNIAHPARGIVAQSWLNIGLFCFHGLSFALVAHGERERLLIMVALGACAVALTTLLGASLRKALGADNVGRDSPASLV